MTSLFIVEDDLHFRSALTRELEAHGFEVSSAPSVELALAALARNPADVLLTDLRLHGQDGLDLLKRLPTVSRRTRTILMSAYASARDHQIATELGAVSILVKPFTSSELLQSIQKAIDCETGFQGSIHGLSLIDMAQMFHLAQRSVTLVINVPGGPPSKIHFQKGEIIHAAHQGIEGPAALRAILATPSGTIHTTGLEESVPHTIGVSFDHLLLESLSQLDEEIHEAQRSQIRRIPTLEFRDDSDDNMPAGFSAMLNDDDRNLLLGLDLGDEVLPPPPTAPPLAATKPAELPPAAPVETGPDPSADAIYSAWTPPPKAPTPPPPPPLEPALNDACRDIVRAVDGAIACAILGLERGFLLGYHEHEGGLKADAVTLVGEAARELFVGSVGRLASLDEDGGETALNEALLTATRHHIFAKRLPEQRRAVVVITDKTISIGMGWAMLRSKLEKFGRTGP